MYISPLSIGAPRQQRQDLQGFGSSGFGAGRGFVETP